MNPLVMVRRTQDGASNSAQLHGMGNHPIREIEIKSDQWQILIFCPHCAGITMVLGNQDICSMDGPTIEGCRFCGGIFRYAVSVGAKTWKTSLLDWPEYARFDMDTTFGYDQGLASEQARSYMW